MVTKTVTVADFEQLHEGRELVGKRLKKLVPEVGLEPTRRIDPRGILSPVRLPIPPLRHQRLTIGYDCCCWEAEPLVSI